MNFREVITAGRRAAREWAPLAAAIVLASVDTATVRSTEPSPPTDLAWVAPDAKGMLSVRVATLWAHPALKQVLPNLLKNFPDLRDAFEKQLGVAPPGVERLTLVLPRIGPRTDVLVYLRTMKPYDRRKVLESLGPTPREEKHGGQVLYAGHGKAVVFLDELSFLIGETGEVQSVLDRGRRKSPGPLIPALSEAVAGLHALVAGGDPSAPLNAEGGQLPPGVEPFRSLMEALAVVATADLDGVQGFRATVRFDYPSEDKARQGAESFRALLKLADKGLDAAGQLTEVKNDARIVDLLKETRAGLRGASVKAGERQVRVEVAVKSDLVALGDALRAAGARARSASGRARSMNNLKQIALAMHNYHDVNGRLPPAATSDKDGKPLLSWRVLILPYVEQAPLYRQFHLDEPWDSPHNKKLLTQVPPVFVLPEARWKTGETGYLGFVGKGAFFDGKKGLRFPADFPDGTSNTLMVVEAEKSVPWSQPSDLPFDPARDVAKFGFRKEGFLGAMCDGSVRLFSYKLKPSTLRYLIDRKDGMVIDDKEF